VVPLSTIQKLLVGSALLWAVFPVWGLPAFAAAWVVLAVGTVKRRRQALVSLEPQVEELSRHLRTETIDWVRKQAFFYLWPETSKEWGTTWRLSGFLSMILAGVFVARAIFFREFGNLGLLLPLLLVFVAAAWVSLGLMGEGVNSSEWEKHKPEHLEAMGVLGLRKTVGPTLE
jgi:hypothetical protein